VRRIIAIVLIIAVAAFVARADTAHAAVRWPANCHNFKCVNAHLNALHKANRGVKAKLNHFLNCVVEQPFTQYYDYQANDGVSSRGAVANTRVDTSIDIWLVGMLPGTCGLGVYRTS